ncbi:MAG: hypothetical protein V4582_02030 [Pseudomonadota bacterium]
MATLHWMRRPSGALVAAGMVASGGAARAVLAQLRGHEEAQLAQLSVVATRDLLVLLGAAEHLPWSDGVSYCAPDPVHRTLWLPTHTMPAEPLDLVQANLLARGAPLPFLLWHLPEQVLPLEQPTTLDRAVLAWLEQELD